MKIKQLSLLSILWISADCWNSSPTSKLSSCSRISGDRPWQLCRLSPLFSANMDALLASDPMSASDETNVIDERTTASLAGDYLVKILQNPDHSWALYPLKDANAAEALSLSTNDAMIPVVELICSRTEADVLEVEVSILDETANVDSDLLLVLQLILLQHTVNTSPIDMECRISVGSSKDILHSNLKSPSGIQSLFSSLIDDFDSVEWVEMVTGTGDILGKVPRRLVHSFNLLHRGIGLFVTKDEPMMKNGSDSFPPLYVHRRVDTKRIFPSLYDMFVGGVSMADESQELTARREVAEELGLSRALDDKNALSDHILDCVVCTGYNRCFVSLFSYTMNTSKETISWQEEEVAWGDFVPYPSIVSAADRSILRLAEKKEWPGKYPPIQSALEGTKSEGVTYDNEDYMTWDFVPDGLLVWEAWLEKLEKDKTK